MTLAKQESARNISAEFVAALNGLDDVARRWLLSEGVPPGIIEVSPGPVTVAKIETFEPGVFQFSESGRRAFVHPVHIAGPFSDICDLIAWRPSDPGQFWNRFYSGTPLGVEQLDLAENLGEPLAIWRSPLNWLRAGGDGIFITSWPRKSVV